MINAFLMNFYLQTLKLNKQKVYEFITINFSGCRICTLRMFPLRICTSYSTHHLEIVLQLDKEMQLYIIQLVYFYYVKSTR